MSGDHHSDPSSPGEWTGGVHAVLEVLNERPGDILEVWMARGDRDRMGMAIIDAAHKAGIEIQQKSRMDLDQVLAGVNHQGVAVRQAAIGYLDLGALLEGGPARELLVALDGVMDPRNLGAILRTCWAFGVGGLVIPRHRAVGLTAAAVKTAAGAASVVPACRVVNLVQALEVFKREGYWIYGAALEGSCTLDELDLSGRVVVVLGAEGKGIRPAVRKACDRLFRIPMEGAASSLNVSVAAGIILHRAYLSRNIP